MSSDHLDSEEVNEPITVIPQPDINSVGNLFRDPTTAVLVPPEGIQTPPTIPAEIHNNTEQSTLDEIDHPDDSSVDQKDSEFDQTPSSDTPVDNSASSSIPPRRSTRNRKPPKYLEDYEI